MNTKRVIDLANAQGKTISYLCGLIGKNRYYIHDMDRKGYPLKREYLEIIAADLGTTVEYLNEETDDPRPDREEGVKIPVLGEVAAGLPIEAVENIVDWENITSQMARGGDYFGLVIKGRSMEPRMVAGDVVIVRKQETCENGQLAIVAVNGDRATCKKVMLENDGLRLVSINPLFPDQVYSKAAVEQLPIRILGVVVELRAKF